MPHVAFPLAIAYIGVQAILFWRIVSVAKIKQDL
jgi:hypothetical protein